MIDLVLHSEQTITPEGIRDVFVSIIDGHIVDVSSSRPDSCRFFAELGDSVLMPGIIDPHVHINEPGRTDWEGFDTGTRSALKGGITTIVDMPLNSSPVTTSVAALEAKQQAAKQHLHCDCGFWGGVIPGNSMNVPALIKKGVPGFKAFLTHSGIDEFPNVDEEDLRRVIPLIAEAGLPLLVHCELDHAAAAMPSNPRSYREYLHSRPQQWETDAIALMIRLCEEYRCRVHIVHLSAASALPMIVEAKQRGLPLTVETAQHYLHFNAEEIPDGATLFKCAPPIREKKNNELLWQALKDGIIDFVATDHSPAPPDLKSLEEGSFQKGWGGISSLQLALPALWTAAIERHCSPPDICRWLCGNPADLIGQPHKLGKIRRGYSANLVAWKPGRDFTASAAELEHRHKLSPYLGRQLKGVVTQTYLHGQLVFEDGIFLHLNSGKIITSGL